MLEKFISIKNVGRFRDCCPRGDVTFRKLTLIFAENGRGKTTLCAVLRSLQTGQPEFISERKTLGSNDRAFAQIRLSGNNFIFGNNAWAAIYPDIAIFDSVFVHNNVYAGDYVDHEQKKNLYRVIVGAQGVQLAIIIDDLDGKIRTTNSDMNARQKKKQPLIECLSTVIISHQYNSRHSHMNSGICFLGISGQIRNSKCQKGRK
jgi:wobble nucleotide-excising tRNase